MYTIKKIWSSDITELISKHASLEREEVSSCETIVYKVNASLIDHLNASPSNLLQLAVRWKSKTVLLIAFEKGDFRLLKVDKSGLIDLTNSSELLPQIRNHDLSILISGKASRCAIKAPHGGHFITPSGKHAKSFIRVGDAINSFNSMDRISFWLQKELSDDVSGVVVDTPSLLSVLVHTINLRNRNIPFTCLTEGVGGVGFEEKSNSILRKFSSRLAGSGKVLLVISMSVSGTTRDAMISCVRGAGIDNSISAVSVFCLKEVSSPRLCQLDLDLPWYPSKEKCSYCKDPLEQRIYEIDGGTFFPKLSEQKTVVLRESHFRRAGCDNGIESFYRRYGTTPGVFRFHYSDRNDGYNARHHAFYVHVLSLLKVEQFVSEMIDRLVSIVKERGAIDLVIHPPHPAAREMVRLARAAISFEVIESTSLDPIEFHDDPLIKSAEHILVLDDVLMTGSRQLGYLRNLREIVSDGKLLLKHVTFFPLITRVERQDQLQTLSRAMTKHTWINHSETLYQFVLPRWSENKCPWCIEKKMLKAYTNDPLGLDDWLQNRLELLEDLSDQGIVQEPLLRFDGMLSRSMSAASPIVAEGCSEQVVLFVLASGMQELRSDRIAPLGNDLLYSNLLCLSSLDVFSDQLIQSCMFRATKPEEWTDRFYEEVFDHGVSKAFKNSDKSLLPEILVRAFEASRNSRFSSSFLNEYREFLGTTSVRQLISRLELGK